MSSAACARCGRRCRILCTQRVFPCTLPKSDNLSLPKVGLEPSLLVSLLAGCQAVHVVYIGVLGYRDRTGDIMSLEKTEKNQIMTAASQW